MQAEAARLPSNTPAQGLITPRHLWQSMKQRTKIEERSADEDGHTAARHDLVAGRTRQPRVVRGVEIGIGVDDVEEMMWHPRANLDSGLGAPNVEAAIDLHRVVVHDLAANRLGDLQRNVRFAGAGGPGDDDGQHARGSVLILSP